MLFFSVLFYGDDTWLSMFSAEKHFLERSEGTSSFYVKDYTSVDTNITRHLAEEFGAAYGSWDILLLHYHGLDHIGMVVESQTSQFVDIFRAFAWWSRFRNSCEAAQNGQDN